MLTAPMETKNMNTCLSVALAAEDGLPQNHHHWYYPLTKRSGGYFLNIAMIPLGGNATGTKQDDEKSGSIRV